MSEPNYDFSTALNLLKGGNKLRRFGWNGKGMWLKLIQPGDYTVNGAVINDKHVERMAPWIGMRTADAQFVPWLASQTDLLSQDWELA